MNRRSDTTNILFWNTGNQKVERLVGEMADALEVDIFFAAAMLIRFIGICLMGLFCGLSSSNILITVPCDISKK